MNINKLDTKFTESKIVGTIDDSINNDEFPMELVLANEHYRGFDYFWGFYGGLENYCDKTAAILSDHSDSDDIKNDDTEYYEFWKNREYYNASGTYSTYQHLDNIK